MEDSGAEAPYPAGMERRPTTRLAPTPSGALHVGNARTFLVNWALARRLGWRIVLRLEDLDLGRVKDGAHAAAIADMRWIGVDWDGEPEVQSRDLEPYREALSRLAAMGRTFRCDRSRAEIRSAPSAPHADDGETRYPPELRPAEPWFREVEAWGAAPWEANHRLRLDPAPERVHDEFLGDGHDFAVITEGLIELHHGELGIVAGADALVAEHAANLVDALHTADDESFQVQLEGDAQIQLHVE